MLTAWRRVKPNCVLVIALNVESAERHAFAVFRRPRGVSKETDGRKVPFFTNFPSL